MAAKKKQTGKSAITERKNQFFVVGIGASAGGLEAMELFFSAMPPDSGLAFVLVSHLDPTHISILPEILQKKTKMKVQQAADNLKIVPNQVYIIPPNKELAILNSTLQLLETRYPRGSNLPIDTFFRSLAQDKTNRVVGIILSGTGTDGTLGIRAIKGETGMIMVQDPDSAKYDGMPKSAIATGLADYVMPPDRMPEQLLTYVKQAYTRPAGSVTVGNNAIQGALQKIFILLRNYTGHDFSLYKPNTINRRIERRMHVHQIDKISDYVRYLQESERETTVLFKELLIGVTNFFRDPKAFTLLKERYLPELLKDKPAGYPVRIWVPGCSTGEETYSIAIILQECITAMGRDFSVQIFGTDLDEDAINTARAAVYPDSIAVDVSPERLKNFFIKEGDHYQVKKAVRDMVVFAPQNIIKDPPFTKLDLLSCRNLLIYLGKELQQKLLSIFHYSLKQDAILFLGSSETIGDALDLFTIMDKKWKIFRRRPAKDSVHPVLDFPILQPRVEFSLPEIQKPLRVPDKVDTQQLLKSVLSQSDLPPCVIIDDCADIIYIHGRVDRFLELVEGEICYNIIEMARPGLKTGLSSGIRQMAEERQETRIKGIQVKDNGDYAEVNLIIRPLSDLQTGRRGLMMVIFDEVVQMKKGKAIKPQRATKNIEFKRLKDELQYTRESLQTTIEELETSNEEMKSTNEELQSTNEELQSTNEELETSKEELQSLNEESVTVNAELQTRIDELSIARDDIKNLLDATRIAIIFLDINLCVRRFTPQVTALIPLISADVGRPVSHFANNLTGVKLEQYALKVLKDLAMQEVEVQDIDGQYYRMRIRPYRTLNNVIDGVVVTFEDITELKLLDQAKRLAAVVKDSNDAIILHDIEGNIRAWNKGAMKIYGYTETEALKMNMKDMIPRELKDETMVIIDRLKNKETISFITRRLGKEDKTVHVWLTASMLVDDKGTPEYIATTEKDMSLLTKDAIQLLKGMNDGHG